MQKQERSYLFLTKTPYASFFAGLEFKPVLILSVLLADKDKNLSYGLIQLAGNGIAYGQGG